MKRRILLTILLFVPILLLAQFTVSQLDISSGLSSNYVTSITQDKDGCIWAATEEGLNKFHGQRFYAFYKRGMSNSISGNELNVLLDDPEDPVMWIGTQRNGLNAYNYHQRTTRYYSHDPNAPQSLCTNDITFICTAKDKNIWVCTYWEGIDLLNKQKDCFEHFNMKTVKGMPSNQTWCALDDGEGHLYVGHVGQGLTIIDIARRTARNFLHHDNDPHAIIGNHVHSLCRDNSGNIWVGTDKGLDLFNPQTQQFDHFLDEGRLSRRIFDIKEMSNGQIWAATEQGGIAVITRKNGMPQYTYITEGNNERNLTGNSVRCLFEDRFQNVWIGVYGSGINFLTYHLPMFTQIGYQPSDPLCSLTMKTVLAVCQDQQDRLWIGTDGDGVNLFENGRRLPVSIPELSSQSVQAAICDSRGDLWFGCFNDNAYIKHAADNRLTRLFTDRKEDIRFFYEDNNGNMWICTSNGIYQADINTHTVKAHYQLGQNLTRSMVIDRKGRRWIGTFGEGIFICSPKMEITAILDTKSNFPSNTVNQLMLDQHGQVWAATAEGLVKFDQNDKMTVYGWGSGLDNIHIRAVNKDSNGNIWVSTNKGISCLKDGETAFCNFTTNDHVPLANFSNACTAHGNSRELLFGSTAGLSIFIPEEVLSEQKAPLFSIVGMKLYTASGDSIVFPQADHSFSLNYDENTFTISFNIENYALYNETEYAYRMEGVTGDWTTLEGSEMTFRNLKPGRYRVLVRSHIRNHKWSDSPIEINIAIAPPFWQSWWAILFYLLCLAAIGYYVYHGYQNYIHLRILKEQWERMSNATHPEQEQDSRRDMEQKRQTMQASLNELDQQFLSKINKLIEDRISSDKTDISYIAEAVNISQSTLYRKMKSLTGISTVEYVRKYKMHYAEQLLLTGRYTISEVGYMVGMSSQSYFRKCFKDEFHVNPSDYQKQVKS